jgi:hypothetical protein
MIYNLLGDPSFLAKDFLHRKIYKYFIEPYIQGVPQTFSAKESLRLVFVGHYNCLINSNNQVKHKLSTQGSLLFQR